MPNAVFVAPFLLEATNRFIGAAASLPGAQVGLISQDPQERLPEAIRSQLAGHYRIDDGTDAAQIAGAVERFRRHLGGVDRVIGTLEQLQVPLARVREWFDIAGMRVEAAQNFRDKARMKSVMRDHGVPCAGHALAASPEEALRAARALGLPLVVKPPAGAGARGTFRVDTEGQLHGWLRFDAPSPDAPALLEQAVSGEEHSFDSVMAGGRLVWHSVSRYLPTPLEVLENPWIQWAVLLPREIGGYHAIREAGERALRVLGMDTGLSHMEWFNRGADGIAISEVAARPPGAQFMTLMSYSHDVDMYRAWAGLEIFGAFDPPERHYAVGAAYLRGQGSGRVRAIHGLDTLQHELGDLVVEARLPAAGQAPSGTYEGEGYVILRHPETSVVEAALRRVVDVARVELAGA
ncbi:MAG: hypothetical protein JOZ46_07055 [Candidatus Dormibacteraeota bacterium]|nr:hypothetical protein [Candidatus Dormibacteraeota bacterium]MBV9525555.1 hypothetical protein [Candidatus Dormibacteraeota bacterium]